MNVDWEGPEVLAAVRQAARKGLLTVAARAQYAAQRRAPVLTGALQGSIRPDPPEEDATGVSVTWGSHLIDYAYYQETEGRRAGFMRRAQAEQATPERVTQAIAAAL